MISVRMTQVLWTIPFPFLQWILVFVGATLSGSVIVLALWKPLSSHQRGIAVALLAIVLALHFLLAAGLQLYFFRYTSHPAVHSDAERSVTTQLNNLTEKVTELKPLSLVLDEKLLTNLSTEAHPTSANLTVIDSQSTIKENYAITTTLSTKTDYYNTLPVQTNVTTANSSSSALANKIS